MECLLPEAAPVPLAQPAPPPPGAALDFRDPALRALSITTLAMALGLAQRASA
jgi:hypothetical protein